MPIIAVFGRDWFTSSDAWIRENETLFLLAFGVLAGVSLILVLWKAFLFVKCLAEVHAFSAWRGLGAVVIGALAVVLPVAVLFFGCSLLASLAP